MEISEKSASLMKCGAVLAGAAFAMGAMHSGVAHADSVKADANTASSTVTAKTSSVTPAPVAKSAANAGLASSAKASSATTVQSVASSNVKTVTPVVSSAKSSAPVKAATPAKQADDSFGVPAQSSSNNDGQNGLSGVKHVTSDTAKSSEVTSANVTYVDKGSNVVEVANDTVDYSGNPINQSTANKIAQSTVPAGYKVDKVYYSGSNEGLADGVRMEHMMTIKAIVSQANEGLVLQTDTNGSVSNGGLTLTPVGNQPSSSSNSAPVKVVINYQENGNTIATVNTTTTPNSPVDVSKSCPSGYQVSKDYTNPSSTVVNGVATFNVPVVKARATANNGQVTVTIQYTNNGQVIKTATETVPDKGQVDVVKDLPSGYEVQPGWSGSDMSTKDGKVTMVVPVVQANPSLQPDAGNTAGSSSVNNEVPAGDSGSSSSASGSTSANTPAGSTSSNGSSSSSAPAAGSNTSSSTGSSSSTSTPAGSTTTGSTSSSTAPAGSTTGASTPDTSVTGSTSSSSASSPAATVNGDKSSSSASTPAADTITITVNGKSMTEKVGDDASLEKIAESLHIQTTTPGHYVYTIQESNGKSVVSVADPFAGTKWVAANNGLKINIVGFSKTSGTAPATQGTEDTDNRDIYPGEGILSNGHQQSSTVTDGTIQGIATTGQSTGSNNSNNNASGSAKAKAQAGLSAAQQANVARDEANGSAVAEGANASQAASAIANGASVQSQAQEGSASGLPDTGDASVAAIAALSVMGALVGAGAFMKKRMAD